MTPQTKSLIAGILTTLLIIVHSVLVAIDFFGIYPVADFLRRQDGSQMEPQAMLPQEEVLVAMLAFPFGICVLGFFLLKNRSEAALLSSWIHGMYAAHQLWKKPIWDAMLHPDTDISTEFFLISHIVWTVVSAVIYTLTKEPDEKSMKKS